MGLKKLYIYIIHAKHLTERRKVIDELRKDIGKYTFSSVNSIEIQTIDAYDVDEITPENIQASVNYSPIESDKEEIKIFNALLRILHVNNISNAMKHLNVLKKIAEDTSSDSYHLVVEDDIMYEPRMCMLLDKLLAKLTSSDEIVFLGMPNNEPVTNTNTITIKSSKEVFKILPYNDSYIIQPKTAKTIVDMFLPIKFYTNIQISYICEYAGIKIKQCVPNIFVDGTKFGTYLSSQMVNNDLVFNKDYMFVKNMSEKTKAQVTKDDIELFKKIRESSGIANNPDFLVVAGKCLRYIFEDYNGARELYQKAFDMYQRNNIIINNESMFLRDFISLHAHLQE